MTLEELLGCPESWEDFLVDEKKAHDYFEAAGVLNITRPDRPSAIYREQQNDGVKKKKPMNDAQLTFRNLDSEKQKTLQRLAAEQGLDLNQLMK